MINPPDNEAARLRAIARMMREQSAYELVIRGKLFKEFERAADSASNEFETAGPEASVHTVIEHHEHVRQLMFPFWEQVMQEFGGQVFDQLKRPVNRQFIESMQSWLGNHGARKVVQISGTTRTQIRSAINDGINQGLGQEGTAKLIREQTGGRIGKLRSRVIARTETHGAALSGTVQAADAIHIPYKKEWMSAHDERVRTAHRAADGQLKNQSDPFEVGGGRLMYPGDPNGSAWNTINCRCQVGIVIN